MNIKSIIKYNFFILILFFTITSCEDKIDIEVEPLTEQLVVDAWLTDQPVPQSIKLSMTQPYFNNEQPLGLNGATVTVTSSTGNVFNFIETGSGNYVWTPEDNETIGDIGTDYSLQINLDGQSYGSISSMNRVPTIDSINYEFRIDETFGPDGIYAEFFARDPIGGGDTYWIKSYKNGVFLNKPDEINLAYDAGFSAGGSADGFIFITPIREAINRIPDPDGEDNSDVAPWAVGDEIKVELHSINNDAFYFLSSAQTQITNGNSGIFSEPVINTTGNVIRADGEQVLGMFNVSAVSEMTILVE